MSEDPSGDEPKEIQLSRVAVYAELTDSFRAVSSTRSSPVFLVGGQDGRPILVPFAELNFIEQATEDDDEETMLSIVLTFENLAYLVESLAGDFLGNCNALSAVSSGDLKPPADRVTYSLEKLRGAQASLAQCIGLLETLQSTLEQSASPRPRRRLRPKF